MQTLCLSFPTYPNLKDPVKKNSLFLPRSYFILSLTLILKLTFRLYAALFQSLLLEACGRTVNPVNGAVGLLWTGNWHVCQAAVETVLRGGTPRPIPEFLGLDALTSTADDASEGEVTCNDARKVQDPNQNSRFVSSRSNKVASGGKRKRYDFATTDLNLRLTPCFLQNALTSSCRREIRRPGTPSMNSEESVTTMTSLESGIGDQYVNDGDRKVLNLFV